MLVFQSTNYLAGQTRPPHKSCRTSSSMFRRVSLDLSLIQSKAFLKKSSEENHRDVDLLINTRHVISLHLQAILQAMLSEKHD
jgi:hypothetical protein